MIFTLTLNPAIDKTVVIPSFSVDTVNRVQSLRTDVGGKGINVSKCLASLGCESTAVAFWGGDTGTQGERFLVENRIRSLAVRVSEPTRTNLKIIDPEKGQNTDINEPGPVILPEQLEALWNLLKQNIHGGDTLILSGSLPRGIEKTVYRDISGYFGRAGVRVILDADGEAFSLGLQQPPFLVKPNTAELSRLLGRELTDLPQILSGAQTLLSMGIRQVAVSMGGDGLLLVDGSKALWGHGLQVPVKSTVGAGDSVVAALAYSLEYGKTPEEALTLAIAISAASVMCSGTQAPAFEIIQELEQKVTFEEVL